MLLMLLEQEDIILNWLNPMMNDTNHFAELFTTKLYDSFTAQAIDKPSLLNPIAESFKIQSD